MKIELQVASLEQSKRLKELGVTAPSLISWYPEARSDKSSGTAVVTDGIGLTENVSDAAGMWHDEGLILPAYTVAELDRAMLIDYAGNLMPSLAHYHDWMNEQHINHKSSASLKAALLIHFLETKVITVAQVNNRLNA